MWITCCLLLEISKLRLELSFPRGFDGISVTFVQFVLINGLK